MGTDRYFESLRDEFARLDESRRSFLMRTGLATIGAAVPAWTWAQSPFAEAQSKVVEWTDKCGQVHDRISEYWAKQCEVLPCFHGVCFKGYAEKVIENVLLPGTNERVIVHLWKGNCPKFPLRADYPGGHGAEIGVYKRRSQEWINQHTEERRWDINSWWFGRLGGTALQLASLKPGDKWYPAPELKAHIQFRLLDPENNDAPLLDTGKAGTVRNYWCTEWLRAPSYERWQRVRPQWLQGKALFPSYKLTLQYWINGVEQSPWAYKEGDENCAFLKGYG